MDDNACPHTVNVIQEYLQRKGITRLDLPTRFSEVHPIEHMWDELQVRIYACQFHPGSTQELGAADNIPQSVIQNLIGDKLSSVTCHTLVIKPKLVPSIACLGQKVIFFTIINIPLVNIIPFKF